MLNSDKQIPYSILYNRVSYMVRFQYFQTLIIMLKILKFKFVWLGILQSKCVQLYKKHIKAMMPQFASMS